MLSLYDILLSGVLVKCSCCRPNAQCKRYFMLIGSIMWQVLSWSCTCWLYLQLTLLMGCYVLSLDQWKCNSSLVKDTLLDHALSSFCLGQQSSFPSKIGQVANHYGVNKSTLWRQLYGICSNREAHKASQLLTVSEEEALVHFVLVMGVCFLPLSHTVLQE